MRQATKSLYYDRKEKKIKKCVCTVDESGFRNRFTFDSEEERDKFYDDIIKEFKNA